MAVPLGEAAATAVRALVDGVIDDSRVREAGRLRWAVTQELHLTVRFLGPTSPARVPDVAAAAHAAVVDLDPFEVRLRGAGAFPSPSRPRVVWLGIERGAPQLEALAGSLARELAARGWAPDDRPFRAHLTLARADGVPGAARAVDALAAAAANLDAAWTADRLVVYRSELGHRPPRYTPLATARLGGPGATDEGPVR